MIQCSAQAEAADTLLSLSWQQLQFPAHSNNISIFLLGDLTLLSCLVRLLLIFHFCQELLVHPHRPCALVAWFPAHWDRMFLSLEQASLKINKLSWTPLLSEAVCHGVLLRRSMKSALLKSRVVILLFALFCTLRILDSIISWPLQPRPPPASTSLTSSSLFASMRFSRASALISFLITSVRKLPSAQSRDLLDRRCLAVLLFQLILEWLKFSMRSRACEQEASSSCLKKGLVYLFLIRRSVIDAHNNGITLIWLITSPKAELRATPLLYHIKSNSPCSPYRPVLPKEPIYTHGSTPVMWAIPPRLCDPNEIADP